MENFKENIREKKKISSIYYVILNQVVRDESGDPSEKFQSTCLVNLSEAFENV